MVGEEMTEQAISALRDLFDYMAGWNGNHMRGVSEHEIEMMRLAAAEGHRILEGAANAERAT